MIGSTVSADTTTAPTPIAAAMPSLPISGMPITSRPAIATITTTPAATTDAPEVAAAFADASRGRVAGGDLLAVAADDQQRVVDARAEAEHDRDHRRELRQVERLGEGDEQDLADHHAEQRADERRRHRRERAEQQRQQDDRHADADQLADRRVLLGGEVDQDAARRHVDAALLGGVGGLQQRLAVGLLEVLRLGRVADLDGREARRRARPRRPRRTGPRPARRRRARAPSPARR